MACEEINQILEQDLAFNENALAAFNTLLQQTGIHTLIQETIQKKVAQSPTKSLTKIEYLAILIQALENTWCGRPAFLDPLIASLKSNDPLDMDAELDLDAYGKMLAAKQEAYKIIQEIRQSLTQLIKYNRTLYLPEPNTPQNIQLGFNSLTQHIQKTMIYLSKSKISLNLADTPQASLHFSFDSNKRGERKENQEDKILKLARKNMACQTVERGTQNFLNIPEIPPYFYDQKPLGTSFVFNCSLHEESVYYTYRELVAWEGSNPKFQEYYLVVLNGKYDACVYDVNSGNPHLDKEIYFDNGLLKIINAKKAKRNVSGMGAGAGAGAAV